MIYHYDEDIFVKRSHVQVTQINEVTIQDGWPDNAEYKNHSATSLTDVSKSWTELFEV